MTIEAELFDGTVLEFPDGTDPQVIQRVVKTQTAQRRQAAPAAEPQAGEMVSDALGNPLMMQPPRADAPQAPLPTGPAPRTALQTADGYGASLFDGLRQGVSMLVGAPVDLVNNAPRLANILPGVEGVGPISDKPIGGRETVDSLLRLGGLVPDYQPQTSGERIVNRTGEEIGASLVPAGIAVGTARALGTQAVTRMANNPASALEGVAGMFLKPAAVNPAGLIGRETAYAAGAGAGAGIANEAAGENQGVVSDLVGSLLGTGVVAAGSGLFGGLRNVYAGATGNPTYMDDVAGQTVADRLVDNSTMMQGQYARTQQIDTDPLVTALRTPAAVEDAVPGYRADIGDRTRDPGLATFARNANGVSPGARTERFVANNAAVDERMAGLAPEGDATRLRVDVQSGVDRQIAEALTAQDAARAGYDTAAQAVQPGMPDATARGSSIRSALADSYATAKTGVDNLYAPVNNADVPVDIGPLRDAFGQIDARLPLNDAERFRPREADIPSRLAPDDAPAQVPLREVTAMRSGLTDDIRTNRAGGQRQAARVGEDYRAGIDSFLDEAVPEDLRAALTEANTARRDLADRFERPGTALAEVLRTREGGGYALDDSAVGPRLTPTDQGRVTDFGAAWREAGTDPRFREGLMDEVKSQVVNRGLLDKPDALGKFLAERQIILSDFPELRANLERAGAARADLNAAEKAAAETQKRLTTPGRSAPATYLKYGPEASGDAIRAVISSPKPVDAAKELLATANTPTARADLRAALWEEVKRKGVASADDAVGQRRWNGKALRTLFDDPKFSAVAEELWADNPKDLADIKTVFGALASAEGSGRTVVGSGTAQSLTGKFDPALSTSSIASRARSVNRGQLSPTIAVVDVLGTWLRNKSAQVQARAIDQITSAVVNNPGMAADLLEKYNPANAAARRAMLTQKYGVRAATLLNVLEEAENDDPVLDAVREDR